MKINLLKYYIAVFYFCSTYMMFAQGTPGSGSDNGGIDDSGSQDTDPLPIDDYVWVLAVLGLLFVFMKIRAVQKK